MIITDDPVDEVSEYEKRESNSDPDIEPEFTIDAEELILIPENIYTLGYEGYKTGQYFYTPKIKAEFIILDEGEYHGTRLPRFYRVDRLTGTPGRNGKFKPGGWSSNLIRDWIRLFGKPKRGDRLSMRRFKIGLIKGKVETVTKDGKGRPLPKEAYYSAITELISLERIDD